MLPLSPQVLPRTPDGDVVLGIRPEEVALCPDGTPGQVSGVVELGERIGSDVYLSVRMTQGDTIVLSADASNKIGVGETVCMQIPSNNLCFFGPDGDRIETGGAVT